uniref:CAAX prenyl protease 2 n=1 Tax=Amphiprion ocellaris TaxID=80972 RepID=A0AAQ5X1F8_AMPOC
RFFYLGPFIHSAMDDPDGFTGELQSALGAFCGSGTRVGVAPVTEELVFRGAMLPMLVPPALDPQLPSAWAPLFFGVEDEREGRSLPRPGSSQPDILYTTLFGAFTAFIFMRTGHVGPVLCHSFCNSQDPFFYGAIPVCSLAPPPRLYVN